MAKFIGHEPCPRCGSRDNLARYSDGGGYCFGCQYTIRATHYVPDTPAAKEARELPKDLTTVIPEPNLAWLRQYLNDEEIKEYFEYSPSMRRHIYRYINELTGSVYWEARSVKQDSQGNYTYDEPKTLSAGDKPFFLMGKWRSNGKVVLVEDIISAIKLARHCGVVCLFGSSFPATQMVRLAKIPSVTEVIFWLDRDKYKEALKQADRMSTIRKATVLSTDEDPKAIDDEELRELLELT